MNIFNWFKKQEYKTGALLNTEDPRDIPVTAFQAKIKALPEKHITDISNLPVLDQKNNGSCFTADTKIQLSNGDFKDIKDIIIGDNILDAYGKTQIVTQLFHRTYQGNMYEIYPYGINLPIKATSEHPFLLKNGKFKEAKYLNTKDILVIPINTTIKDKTDFNYEKDKDFLRVVGLFLAEGSIDKNRVCFSMASHEEDIIDFINQTIYRIFGIIGYKHLSGKRLSIRFNNKALSEVFYNLCGNGSINKRINSKLLLINPKLQYEIFYGWLLGDGSFKDKKQIIGVSISKTLIMQMFFICLRNKIIPNLRVRKEYGIHKEAYNLEINGNDCNTIRPDIYKKSKKRKSDKWRGYFDGDNLVRRIRKIDIKKPKDKNTNSSWGVYNIETTGSHTYTANFIGVHNCVGHSVALAVAYYDEKEIGKLTNPSPRFLYGIAKRIDGIPEIEGTYPRVAGQIAKVWGCATENTLPNSSNLSHSRYITFDLTEDILNDAKPRKIGGYAFVGGNIDDLKNAILNNGVILASLPVGNWNRIPVKPGSNGYHYILIYGYNKDRFYFRNSWGANWGDKGDGYFIYKDFENQIRDVMVITDIPNEVLEKAKEQWKYKYFKPSEFKHLDKLNPKLIDMLENIRKDFGKPIRVNSDWREEGSHASGCEIDIHSTGKNFYKHLMRIYKNGKGREIWNSIPKLAQFKNDDQYILCQLAIKHGATRIGIYDRHIHFGFDPNSPQKVVWAGVSE